MPRRRTTTAARALTVVLAAGAGFGALGAPARAASSTATCPAVAGAAQAPAPEAVLGRALGAGPTTPEQTDRYLLALDAASPRIRTAVAGTTPGGRPLRYALVGDPTQLTDAALRRTTAAVARVRSGAVGPKAIATAARRPALAWIGGGVHANELSGPPALLEVLATLVAADDCPTRRALHGVLAVVQPDQNPDGHAAGTRTNAAGLDLNRDWFARTQPEAQARAALLRRFPPTVAVDVHEQAGSAYFVPPYASPVLRGLPDPTRRLADGPIGDAVARAVEGAGGVVVRRTYDLLYPGYADTGTSLALGSGGMTLEQGSDPPLGVRIARHRAGVLGALRALGSDPRGAVRAWAAGQRSAVADGRAGRADVGGLPLHGWAIRTDVAGADALALVASLRDLGVRARALRRTTTLRRVDPVGPDGAASRRLPAGTVVVRADQPLRAWLEALLDRDAGEAGVAGEDTWSLPRLGGVSVAALRAPLPRRLALVAVPRAASARVGSRVALAADSAAALGVALRALRGGAAVERTADGLTTTATPGLVADARASRVALRPSAATGTPLRAPQVLLADDGTRPLTGTPAELPRGEQPAGWVRQGLERLGIATRPTTAAALAGGVPAGTTHLVVGPGGAADLAPARGAVQAFVRGGGTVVALGAGGIGAVRTLGLSRVGETAAPAGDAVSVATAAAAPLGAVAPGLRVVVAGEPRLQAPAGSRVPLRAAAGPALDPSGAAGATAGLAGQPLVVEEALGAGHVLSVGFSPFFRSQSAGGARVIAALLLG